MEWFAVARCTVDQLGFIPSFLSEEDPRSAKEQFNENYAHGGGWRPFDGFKFDQDRLQLIYPGDPPMTALAFTKLRGEVIFLFTMAWVVIVQPDGAWEAARLD